MEPTTAGYGDRRRSFGRGGAGNIRSHAEALTDVPVVVGGEQQRRRSSIWSTASSSSGSGTSRGSSILDNVKHMFRRRSAPEGRRESHETDS